MHGTGVLVQQEFNTLRVVRGEFVLPIECQSSYPSRCAFRPQEFLAVLLRLLICWSRFALSAWIGAAALFVVVGIREVTFPGFESPIRDQLVLLRFPAYYVCGAVLLGSTLLALMLSSLLKKTGSCSLASPCGCTRLPIILTLTALTLMAVDFVWIYSPLESLITPPGSPRTPQFITLHQASMYINLAHVGIAALAAFRLCWPVESGTVKAGSSPGPSAT